MKRLSGHHNRKNTALRPLDAQNGLTQSIPRLLERKPCEAAPRPADAPRDHKCRMLSPATAERILRFALACTPEEMAAIMPVFLTLDIGWNCNYECCNCIDCQAADGLPVVCRRQAQDPLHPCARKLNGPVLGDALIENVLEFVKKHCRGVQLMGGETLMHPCIDRVLEFLAENQLPFELVTNGSLIADHLDALVRALMVRGSSVRISINGWSSYGRRVGWPEYGVQLRERVLDGIARLLQALPESCRSRVFVSCVAFADVIPDLPEMAAALEKTGLRTLVIIRERQSDDKTFVRGQEAVRDELAEIKTAHDRRRPRLDMVLGENIRVEPQPQKKWYSVCPSAMLKATLGADGWLYACTDHRGAAYARLVNVADYENDLEKAWTSLDRVHRAIEFMPRRRCANLVCQRFEGNEVIALLRESQIDVFTF